MSTQAALRLDWGLGRGRGVDVNKLEYSYTEFLTNLQRCNVVGNSNDGKDDGRGDTRGLLGIASPPSSSYLCSVLHCCARMLEFACHPPFSLT